MCGGPTRGQQDDGGDNQGADDEDDQQGDGYSFPVPLWRSAAHQVLKNKSLHHTDAAPDTDKHILSIYDDPLPCNTEQPPLGIEFYLQMDAKCLILCKTDAFCSITVRASDWREKELIRRQNVGCWCAVTARPPAAPCCSHAKSPCSFAWLPQLWRGQNKLNNELLSTHSPADGRWLIGTDGNTQQKERNTQDIQKVLNAQFGLLQTLCTTAWYSTQVINTSWTGSQFIQGEFYWVHEWLHVHAHKRYHVLPGILERSNRDRQFFEITWQWMKDTIPRSDGSRLVPFQWVISHYTCAHGLTHTFVTLSCHGWWGQRAAAATHQFSRWYPCN